ncbi:MAG TPA: hypothetical protein VG165_13775 [Solirubrobacteraceae bacterium]|nr:hypothetical protein [Solirubrobacteraceae bacterium]
MEWNEHIARVGALVGLDRFMEYGADQLPVSAQLFAETPAGNRLSVRRPTIIGPMARQGHAAVWKDRPPIPHDPKQTAKLFQAWDDYRVRRRDVEDIINYLLGRDPEQLRPPSLSWGPLRELLRHQGILVTEDELIATPFVFEFSDDFLAELASGDDDAI